MIKAVFFDIDGTLVSFKTHCVSPSTIKALDELKAKGIKVFISSGRFFYAINNLGDLKFDGYVTLNGGCVLVGTDKIIFKQRIPEEDINALLDYLSNEENIPCAFVTEDEIFMPEKNADVEHVFGMLNFPTPPKGSLEQARGKEILQLIAFYREEQEEKMMQILPHCEPTRWNPLFADIVSKGIGKDIGISKLLEYFNIKREETMAFGDGGNDITMLQYAGTGVAMGNAVDAVKAVADYVTDSVDDDGIYNALKHYGVL